MASQRLTDLLLTLEWQARDRALELSQSRKPKLHWSFVAQHYPPDPAVEAYKDRISTAWNAATDLDSFLALAHGRKVPLSRVKPHIARNHKQR